MGPGRPEIEVVRESAAAVRPLRGLVLRPGQPVDRLVYPGDDDAGTVHLAAVDGGEVISVASFYAEPVPERVERSRCGVSPGAAGVRIRGMATVEAFRGRGLGRRLVEEGLAELGARGAVFEAVWCNARTSAAGYYEKLGFVAASAVFELPDIGAHVVMVRAGDGPGPGGSI